MLGSEASLQPEPRSAPAPRRGRSLCASPDLIPWAAETRVGPALLPPHFCPLKGERRKSDWWAEAPVSMQPVK